MKTNPHTTTCSLCGHPIPANGGIITDTGPQHLICRSNQRASVGAVQLEGSTTLLRASDGPCEDAPCCGCCGTVDTSTLTFSEDGMAALFAPDGRTRRPERSAPIDLDQLSDDDLYEHEFAEVLIREPILLDGRLGAAEDDLEERFHVRERTRGAFTLAICNEYGKIVVRLFSCG
jgi:hypothetical protein